MKTVEAFSYVPSKYLQQNQQQSLLQQGGDQSLANISSLAVGFGDTAMYADQTGLRLGDTTTSLAPFSVDMNGNVVASTLSVNGAQIQNGTVTGSKIASATITGGNIAANTITAGNIAANTITSSQIAANSINADRLNVSQLSAITADVGTLTAGTISGVTLSMPNESLGTGNAGKLIWASGARMWGDSSGNIGINAVGGTFIVYNQSTQRFTIGAPGSGQATLVGGLHLTTGGGSDGGNLNVDGSIQVNGHFSTNDDNITFQASGGGQTFALRNMGLISSRDGSNQAHLDWGNGCAFTVGAPSSSTFFVNGHSKSAIVPVKDGYRALYSAEAPEVWFFDFAQDKESIDPLFLEVTEGDMKTVKTIDGELLIFRRRKGHVNKRFEAKTPAEFIKNERFLNMAL